MSFMKGGNMVAGLPSTSQSVTSGDVNPVSGGAVHTALRNMTGELTLTLTAANWSSKTQTVSNAALVASGFSYVVSPASTSYAAYATAQIYADDVTVDGQMTFHCVGEEPNTDLMVSVLKVGVA